MAQSEPIERVIAHCIRDAATGALEIRLDRKRWLFFFRGGQLLFTRSNLKSEQDAAVREQLGDAAPQDLVTRVQVGRRLTAVVALGEDAETSWHDGAEPPHTTPIDLLELLFEVVRDSVPGDQLAQRAAPWLDGWPRCVAAGGMLGLPEPLETYLGDLDGHRPTGDVLSFSPAPPDATLAALTVLVDAGQIEMLGETASTTQVTAVDSGPGGLFDHATPSPVSGAHRAVASSFSAAAERHVSGPHKPADGDLPTAGYASIGGGGLSEPDTGSRFKDQLTGEVDIGALIADAVSGVPSSPGRSIDETDEITAAAPVPGNQLHPLAERLTELGRQVQNAENHFQVLGVPWDSAESDFRDAYHAMARDLHPDRFHDGPAALQDLATELFDRVRMAWEILGNEEKRREYTDRIIHGKKSEEEKAMDHLNAYWEAEETFRKGLTMFRNGRLATAHVHFENAARSQPDELEFQAYFGYTTFATNRGGDDAASDAGLALLRDVLERNKSQQRQLDSGWALLGRAYREKGEPGIARKALVQALRINPSNDDAQREMRRLEQLRSEPDKKKGFFSGLFGKKK